MPQSDHLVSATWQALSHSHQRIQDLVRGALQDVGRIPPSWFEVLLILRDDGGCLSQSELISRIDLSPSWVSLLIGDMERAGHVRRERDPDNRRAAVITLTPAGETSLVTALPVYYDALRRAFRGLPNDELARLAALAGHVDEADEGEEQASGNRAELLQLGTSLVALRGSAHAAEEARALRDVLEAAIIEEAAIYATKEDVDALHAAVASMSRSLDDADGFLEANWEFHRTLAHIVRNGFLKSVYMTVLETISDLYDVILPTDHQFEFLATVLMNHAEIVVAVANHDLDTARRLAAEHRHLSRGQDEMIEQDHTVVHSRNP